nr:hypothetical protein [uncultured Desulfobulbus sp.]
MKKRLLIVLAPLVVPSLAFAEWTPMVDSTMFDGIKADMLTMVGGIVTLFFIILGLAMLMRAGGR